MKKTNWNADEVAELVLDILDELNTNQESIPDDLDLKKYIKIYINRKDLEDANLVENKWTRLAKELRDPLHIANN